jgi:hypothetical protein
VKRKYILDGYNEEDLAALTESEKSKLIVEIDTDEVTVPAEKKVKKK